MAKLTCSDTCIVIQCRYDSVRLPGKILLELAEGKTCLDFLLQRLQSLTPLLGVTIPIIVATTDREVDDPIAQHINKRKTHKRYGIYKRVKVFRGDYTNIAKRLYDASAGYDYIVRITGDDLFPQLTLIQELITHRDEYDYGHHPDLIRGFDSELINREALGEILAKFPEDIEHLEHYLRTENYCVGALEFPSTWTEQATGFSLTLDTPNDWRLIKLLYERLIRIHSPSIEIEYFINYFNCQPWFKEFNKKPHVTIYMVYCNYPIEWLAEALTAIKAQTFNNFEFVFVAYGMDLDETALITLDEYNVFNWKKAKFYFRPEIDNFIDAIQFAISKCSSKYVLRADADDVLLCNALETLVRIANDKCSSIVIPAHDVLETGEYVNPQKHNLFCHALVERKRYDHVKYMKGQQFRDGTSLLKAFNERKFRIDYLDTMLFHHRTNRRSLTSDPEKVKEADKFIIECDGGGTECFSNH